MMKKEVLLKKCSPVGFQDIEAESKLVDVRIDSSGTIIEVGEGLPAKESGKVIEVNGNYVSPGWIDLHTHIYYGATDIGVSPDLIGPDTGVIALADAGSAGEANFQGFKEFIVEPRDYPIKSYLNIGSIGLTATNRISELGGTDPVNLRRTEKVIEGNRDIIKGVKIRASKTILGGSGDLYVRIAKRLAENLKLPLIAHIGEPPVLLDHLVEDILGPGDMVTHCFHGKVGANLLSHPRFTSLYREAQNRGILLDVGHGAASFSYEHARHAIKNDIKPFSISTDMHSYNVDGPVWDLSSVMSKMYAIGLSLKETVEMVTTNPASFLELPSWSRLSTGEKARLTVFKLEQGDYLFEDSAARDDSTSATDEERNQFRGTAFIRPLYSVFNGKTVEAHSRYLRRG